MKHEIGTEIKNKHTGEVLTITDIDHINVTSHTDIRPICVLSDGTRWNTDNLVAHFCAALADAGKGG